MKQTIALVYLLLTLLANIAFADAIDTIALKNRPAEELIPIIKPMLDPGASITGQGFQLFVRTSNENMQQIRQLIAKLDTKARQLLISVFQGEERDLHSLDVDGQIQHEGDNFDANIGSSSSSERGGSVSYSTRNSRGGANTISTRGRSRDNPVYTLRITEGSQGYIQTGSSDPVFTGGIWSGPLFGGVSAGLGYKDVQSGFYVKPRTHADQVTLNVHPYKESRSHTLGGAYDTQSASTVVTGKLGQWIQIGAVTEQTQRNQSSVGSISSTQSRNNAGIWIKADALP